MTRLLHLSFLFLAFQAVSAEPPKLEKQCHYYRTPFQWSFCAWKTKGSRNPDLLYHFHGRGLKEDAWNDEAFGDIPYYPALVREQWQATGFEPPTVVTVTMAFPFLPRGSWLIIEKNESLFSGRLETMVKEIMPEIEARLGGLKGKRLVVGESMGALNASQLLFKAGNLFDRFALLCPPMTLISPFAPEKDIIAFKKRTKADPKLVADVLRLSRLFIPTQTVWESTSPVALAERLGPSSPALYVSCGSRDEYGFYEGAKAFTEIARKHGARVEWRPLYGGHCAVDPISLAKFLSR